MTLKINGAEKNNRGGLPVGNALGDIGNDATGGNNGKLSENQNGTMVENRKKTQTE